MTEIQYDGDAMVCTECQTLGAWEVCLPDGTVGIDGEEVQPDHSEWEGHFLCSCGNIQEDTKAKTWVGVCLSHKWNDGMAARISKVFPNVTKVRMRGYDCVACNKQV